MQPHAADALDEPDAEPLEPLPEETELDDDEQIEAGARTNVRKNIDRLGDPPFALCP